MAAAAESVLRDAGSRPGRFSTLWADVVWAARLFWVPECASSTLYHVVHADAAIALPIEVRHSCEQGDKLAGYNWLEHDGRSSGIQVIKDTENNVELTTQLLKTPGGEEGGSWAMRIAGQPIDARM